MSAWKLEYEGFDPGLQGRREALLTLGNGRFATRGALPEVRADDVHYPGTYLAGCFNRLESEVEGRQLEHESMVNVPNWLPLSVRLEDGPRLHPREAEPVEHRLELDLRQGLLDRLTRFRDPSGRITAVRQRRLVSMAEPALAALETTVTAENWSGRAFVRSGLDGAVENRLVRDELALAGRHLAVRAAAETGPETVALLAETVQSRVRIALAARTRTDGATDRRLVEKPGAVAHELALELVRGRPASVEKVVALHGSHDPAVSEPALAAQETVAGAGSFDELLAAHAAAWEELWARFELELFPAPGLDEAERVSRALNLHLFHLLQTLSPHTAELDAGVPARGLHGEGYRGHVFWDEALVIPFIGMRAPELARSLLGYRRRRLPRARRAAREAGRPGAMFPWQSGSEGRDETPTTFFNPRSGRWMPDNSRLQRHVGLAVAHETWRHYEATDDAGVLARWGAELLLEVARFFCDLAIRDPDSDRYSIRGVMGPDEFHDGYPGAPGGGIDDNAYTNVMTAWVTWRALEALELLPDGRREALGVRLGLTQPELRRMDEVSRRLRVPFLADGTIAQFEGYERLAELDWNAYRDRYGHIGRLDLILEAEGDSPNRYRLSKQADVLMLFYLLSADELRAVFERLGYPLALEGLPAALEFYEPRTTYGSTLSRVVNSWVQARSDRECSWHCLLDALAADLEDTQGGTTREGIHLAAMAATVDIVTRCWTGLEARDGALLLDPLLPPELEGVRFRVVHQDHELELDVRSELVTVRSCAGSASPVAVSVRGERVRLEAGTVRTISLARPVQAKP